MAALVEGVDVAVAEVADQNVIAEVAEAVGRLHNTPGRIERASGGESLHQCAVGGENIDETIAGPVDRVVLGGVLHGVGDIEEIANQLDVERCEAVGDAQIVETAADRRGVKTTVKNINGAAVEVGGVEQVPTLGVGAQGKALINGATGGVIHSEDGVLARTIWTVKLPGRIDTGAPAGDGAILGGEQEQSGSRIAVGRHGEVATAVEDRAGRRGGCAVRTVLGWRDGHDESLGRTRPVIQGGKS